jgi:hypothetical protein
MMRIAEGLELRRKGDGVKVGLARRLRRETTLGWHWIAMRLHMGHWRSAANAVRLKQSWKYVIIQP